MNKQSIENLNRIHEMFVELMKNQAGSMIDENQVDQLAARIIYYIYAYFHGHDKIVEEIRNQINTEYADQIIKLIESDLPDVKEHMLEIAAKDFDIWFEKF